MFLLYFTLRHRQRPDRLNQPLGGLQRIPKRRPDARGGPQDGSKSATSVPRAPPGRPNTASERPWRPSWAQLAQKSRPEAFQRPFWTPRGPVLHPPGGRFSDSFLSRKASPKLSSGQSLCKPTPSTASPPCVTSTCGLVRRRTADQ